MKQTKKQNKKKKVTPQKTHSKRFWTLKRLFGAGFLTAAFIGAVLFLRTPQGKHMMEQGRLFTQQAQEKAHLTLSQVLIEGNNRTKKKDISAVLKLTQGMPIAEIDLNEKKEAIAALPWIQSVMITRRLPDIIIIRVKEKKPIAIWQHHQKYSPIDEMGQPIADDKTVLSNVLLVVGEDAPQNTPQLIQELEKYPEIRKQVRSAVRVGKRRWDLYLNDVENGIVVRLPETDIAVALERLKEFNDSGQILARDLNVIDLKLPDRLIVRSNASLEEADKKSHQNVKGKKK